MNRRSLRAALMIGSLCMPPALAASPGGFVIDDVPGQRKVEPPVVAADPCQAGVTENDDPWMNRVAAATYALNGNGEMTGTHWIDESGFLEEPIALTNTLDVGRVDDGVIDWLVKKHPGIGVNDDVPLPVVAECDDQGLNDIDGRHVLASDAVAALEHARGGEIERGNVGAGTGMRAFDFKAGIGSASRVVGKAAGGYSVGVLLNANTGRREELRIDGYPVGRAFAKELLPYFPRDAALRTRGRAADGSIVVTIATDAPLDGRQLHELAVRATLGIARTGITSHVSSGDLFIAFSTSNVYPRDPSAPVARALVNDDDTMDALFAATAEASEAAVYDALFSARTLAGARNLKFYALPVDRVRALLKTR